MAKKGKGKAGEQPSFDIDAPELPKWIDERAMTAGSYPYAERMPRQDYEKELETLQIELAKLQVHALARGLRIVIVFEGHDGAGKGSCINRFMQHVNPRHAHVIALTKPTEKERGEWYFQRYLKHMPTAGHMTLYDRSWYNRAGVERVMGFCSEDEVADFLREAPQLEAMLVRDGILLFKFFLKIGRETQLKRFHQRRHSPLKRWKLSDIDLAAMAKWDDYARAHEEMFRFTHTTTCPWTVVRANDQRRARLNTLRHVLSRIDYADKDKDAISQPDPKIAGSGETFFHD